MAQDGTAAAGGDTGPGGGVLRRMLAARRQDRDRQGRAPQMPQPVPPTPARAAATAVGRAADRLYGLGVQPISVTPGALTLAELPELLPAPALLVVLQGQGDLVGAMALCPQAVTALIEIQTLGRITARPVEARRPTRSDAMLCADFINALMSELASEMAGLDGFEGIAGYRYASYLDDPRPFALMLEDRPYRSLCFKLCLGGAETREAAIFLALPQPSAPDRSVPLNRDPDAAHAEAPAAATVQPPAPDAQAVALGATVGDAPVDLVGVLCRRRVTLGELRGLVDGKLLHLPRVSLSEARIETPGGQLLAVGKFGEAEGCHAIRLRDPAAPVSQTAPSVPAATAAPPPPPTGPTTGPEPPMDDLDGPDMFRHDDPHEGAGRDGTAP